MMNTYTMTWHINENPLSYDRPPPAVAPFTVAQLSSSQPLLPAQRFHDVALCRTGCAHLDILVLSLPSPLSLCPSLSNLQPSLSIGMSLHQTYMNYKCNSVLACMYSHQLTSGFCLFPLSQSSTFQPGLGQLPGAAAQKCPGLKLRVLLPQICCCFGSYKI